MDDKRANELMRSTAGVGLVVIGLIFLAQQLYGSALPVLSWSYLWPLFVIVPGLVFFLAMLQGGRRAAGLAIPGSIVVTVGVILLFQNSTHQWHSWAYAWALIFPTSVGVGQMIEGWWSGRPDVSRRGSRLARAGIVLFIVAGVFFELVLNIGGLVDSSVAPFVVPGLLILAGAYVLWRGNQSRQKKNQWL